MTPRCERQPLSEGTVGLAAWAVLVALATGCCATQRADEGSSAARGAQSTGAAPREFVALDAEAAAGRLWPQPGPGAYVAPDEAQREALAGLVRGMLTAGASAELEGLAASAGFTVQGWEIAGRRYLAALEQAQRRGGGGAYVVRLEAGATGSPVILQAPHGFYDLDTERIALDLLLAGGGWPRALFVNTAHRYLGADGLRHRQAASPADPCHSPQHLFAVATAAALEVWPQAEVVQLHGFGDEDEEAEQARATHTEVIVSGGLAELATPRSRAVAERLRAALGVEVALFPVDTDRLGGTTNVQGRAIRARGGEFVHIEMSRALRKQLRRDPAARERLVGALRPDPGVVSP